MNEHLPWYKQFWPWFLIALPGCVVLASIVTLILCNLHPVSLVAEDYYKEGKGINRDLSRLKNAHDHAISATMTSQDREAMIVLNKGTLSQYPPIKITFQHRTLPNKDVEKWLHSDADGHYRVRLKEALIGPWYVEINSFDKTWALNGRGHFPGDPFLGLQGVPRQ